MHCLGAGTRVKKVLVVGVQARARGSAAASPAGPRSGPAALASVKAPPPTTHTHTHTCTHPHTHAHTHEHAHTTSHTPQVYSIAAYVEGDRAAKELGVRSRGGFFEGGGDGDYCAALLDGAFGKAIVVRWGGGAGGRGGRGGVRRDRALPRRGLGGWRRGARSRARSPPPPAAHSPPPDAARSSRCCAT